MSLKDIIDKLTEILDSNEHITMTNELIMLDGEKVELVKEFTDDLNDVSALQSKILTRIHELKANAN